MWKCGGGKLIFLPIRWKSKNEKKINRHLLLDLSSGKIRVMSRWQMAVSRVFCIKNVEDHS